MRYQRIIAASLSVFLTFGGIFSPIVSAMEFSAVAVQEVAIAVSSPSVRAVMQASDGKELPQWDGVAQQELLAIVIPLVKAKVQVPERLSQFNSSMSIGENITVEMSWMLPDGQQTTGYEQMTVTADVNGRIMSYYHHAGDFYGGGQREYLPHLPKMTQEAAQEIAFKTVARLCPDLVDQLIAQPTTKNTWYSWHSENFDFTFQRQIDGVPVENQSLFVAVDGRVARVTSMNRNWFDQVEAAQPQVDLQTVEQIKQAFSEQVGLELVYTLTPNAEQPYLIYRVPKNIRPVFDAVTGEHWTPELNQAVSYYPVVTSGSYAVMNDKQALLPQERAALEKMEGLLSSEQLQAKIAEMEELSFDPEAMLERCNYSSDSDGRYYASMFWRLPLSDAELEAMGFSASEAELARVKYNYGSQIEATLDAKTGELLSFYCYQGYMPYSIPDTTKEGLSEVEQQAIAEKFLLTYKAEQMKSARFSERVLSDVRPMLEVSSSLRLPFMPNYYSWIRTVNELDYDLNYLNVNVDTLSGKITSFSQNWQEKLVFPSLEKVITKTDAEKAFLNALVPQLYYFLEPSALVRGAQDARLGYTNTAYQQVMVEAVKGELLNIWQGDIYRTTDQPRFSDLANNPSRDKVELLATMGLLNFLNGEFKPNTAITQQEYLHLLSALQSGPYLSSELELYSRMQNLRILDANENKPEAQVNAGQALKWLLRLANHREVAEMKGIFATSAGIADELKGYAAIGSGMGLLNLQTWKAEKTLTRLDVALFIYDFLSRP